jgi:hypothetical protein
MPSRRPPSLDRARRAELTIRELLDRRGDALRERTARMLSGELKMGEVAPAQEHLEVVSIRLRPQICAELERLAEVMAGDPTVSGGGRLTFSDATRHLLMLGMEAYRKKMRRRA